MDDDEFSDHPPTLGDVPPVVGEVARPNRRRIDPPERRALDRALASRLDRLGATPWTMTITDMVDVETGETFHDVGPLVERWIFAGAAKSRAAAFNALFSAYHAQAAVAGLHAYVLRPQSGKPPLGALASSIRELTVLYGRIMANAKRDGLARAVAVFVHPRWDTRLKVWDLHLHCIADVVPGMEDRFFMRLALKFSTPKHVENIENMAAWANYSASWVIDHRDIANWADAAVEELWDLGSPQLVRKAGDFAAFARENRDRAISWENNRVAIEDKAPRERRQDDRGHPSRSNQQVAYAAVRIGGRMRRCAILRYDRHAQQSRPVHPEAPTARAGKEPTTTTGSIPSTPIRGRSGHQQARRIRRRVAMWETIWPYGTPDRPPRPIRRRLARGGVVIEPTRRRYHQPRSE